MLYSPCYFYSVDSPHMYRPFAIVSLSLLLAGMLSCSEDSSVSEEGASRAKEAYDKALTLYSDGNHRVALVELQRAVAYDYPPAQYALGVIYERGDETVEQNFSEAFKWYQKSAESGYAYAQRNLAKLYEDGLGVKRDVNKAIAWYEKAAAQEDRQAKEALARLQP